MFRRHLLFALLILASCGEKENETAKRYMDIKGYFHQEATRLGGLNTRIHKTVSRNGVSESQENVSPNWETEFSLFVDSDINKAAWSKSYTIQEDRSGIRYTANDPKLRTRIIVIKKSQGRVSQIVVINRKSNNLYSSSEELNYIPDSLYRIRKRQNVVLLGNNNYEISGLF